MQPADEVENASAICGLQPLVCAVRATETSETDFGRCMARVLFLTPDIACEPGPSTLDALLAELDLLHREGADYNGPAAAERIREARHIPTDYTSLDLRQWPDEQRLALVRALDHLDNAGLLDEGARLLRHSHIGALPLRYEVRGLAADIQPLRFISASGEYRPGDRIVLGDGSAWVVVKVEPGLVRPRLVLDDV